MTKTCIVIRLTTVISIHVNPLNAYIQLKIQFKHVWRKLNCFISILANLINMYIKLVIMSIHING